MAHPFYIITLQTRHKEGPQLCRIPANMTASTKRSISDTLPLPTNTSTTSIPQLGLGTYLSPPDQTFASCLHALRQGYRHIDTGQYYGNESEVGRAITESGIAREHVFVSTKILDTGKAIDDDYGLAARSLDKLGGYVDLFLIHSPNCGAIKRAEMWLALERLYKEGKARAIGVSNFGVREIEELKAVGEVWPPHVNQIEVSSACCHSFLLLGGFFGLWGAATLL